MSDNETDKGVQAPPQAAEARPSRRPGERSFNAGGDASPAEPDLTEQE